MSRKDDESERFLSVPEAAVLLRVRPKTIYEWVELEKYGLPVRRHGRRIYFCPEELDAWSKRSKR